MSLIFRAFKSLDKKWYFREIEEAARPKDVCALVYIGQVKDVNELAGTLRSMLIRQACPKYDEHHWCREAVFVRCLLTSDCILL
jgi:hypothetical protein